MMKLLYGMGFVALLATGIHQAGNATAQEKVKVRFIYTPIADYAPFYMAKEKGFFAEQGLDVTLTRSGGTSKSLPQLAGGHIDVSGLSWGASFFNAVARKSPIAVVSSFARVPKTGKGPVALMVSERLWESGVRTSRALKGKRVAVYGPGALAAYLTHRSLQVGGLGLSDVKVTYLPPPAFGQAFANGSIDAGMVFEPFVTIYERRKFARRISPVGYAAGVEEGLIVANTDFIKKNPGAVVGFVAAYLKAARWLQEEGGWNSPETVKAFAKYTKITAPLLKMIGKTRYDLEGKINFESVRAQEKLLHDQGLLSYKGPMPTSRFYRADITKKAVALLGKK